MMKHLLFSWHNVKYRIYLIALPFLLVGFFDSPNVFAQPNIVTVSSIKQLKQVFAQLTHSSAPTTILIAAGRYKVTDKRLVLPRGNIKLIGATGNPKDVIFDGGGMENGVGFLFDVSYSHVTISGITLRGVKNHLIQVRAERGASHFTLTNSILQDAREQLLKISASNETDSPYAESGVVSGCLFEYTAGIGPQFYIGGINCHRCRNWLVEGNVFKNIASPEKRVAQHAIHFWRRSENTTVRNNIIINSDRGIGFGLGFSDMDHKGGVIHENFILNQGIKSHLSADVGIVLESAQNTVISNNTIQLLNNYPNAIEYRFSSSFNNTIIGNHTNKLIKERDNGEAKLIDNNTGLAISATTKYLFKKLVDSSDK